MNEQQIATEEKKPRKPIRHMIWAVCLIALGLMLLGELTGELLVGLTAGFFHITDSADRFLLMYLAFIGIDVTVILYTLLCERPILRSFGYKGPNGGSGNTWKMLGLGFLAGFAMNAACILAAWLHGDIDLSVGQFRPLYLLTAVLCVGIQSGAEELLTRGYMLGAMRDRYHVWLAAVCSSLFFGVLHIFNPGITVLSMINVVLFGFVMSIVMIKLNSLWFCIAAHTAWNFSQSIFFGLPNSGIVSEGSFFKLEASTNSRLFYDEVFGIEGAITATVVQVLLAAVILLAVSKKRARTEAPPETV